VTREDHFPFACLKAVFLAFINDSDEAASLPSDAGHNQHPGPPVTFGIGPGLY
jgi:hypothetical protein